MLALKACDHRVAGNNCDTSDEGFKEMTDGLVIQLHYF